MKRFLESYPRGWEIFQNLTGKGLHDVVQVFLREDAFWREFKSLIRDMDAGQKFWEGWLIMRVRDYFTSVK